MSNWNPNLKNQNLYIDQNAETGNNKRLENDRLREQRSGSTDVTLNLVEPQRAPVDVLSQNESNQRSSFGNDAQDMSIYKAKTQNRPSPPKYTLNPNSNIFRPASLKAKENKDHSITNDQKLSELTYHPSLDQKYPSASDPTSFTEKPTIEPDYYTEGTTHNASLPGRAYAAVSTGITSIFGSKNSYDPNGPHFVVRDEYGPYKDASSCTHEPSIHGQQACFKSTEKVSSESQKDKDHPFCEHVQEPTLDGDRPRSFVITHNSNDVSWKDSNQNLSQYRTTRIVKSSASDKELAQELPFASSDGTEVRNTIVSEQHHHPGSKRIASLFEGNKAANRTNSRQSSGIFGSLTAGATAAASGIAAVATGAATTIFGSSTTKEEVTTRNPLKSTDHESDYLQETHKEDSPVVADEPTLEQTRPNQFDTYPHILDKLADNESGPNPPNLIQNNQKPTFESNSWAHEVILPETYRYDATTHSDLLGTQKRAVPVAETYPSAHQETRFDHLANSNTQRKTQEPRRDQKLRLDIRREQKSQEPRRDQKLHLDTRRDQKAQLDTHREQKFHHENSNIDKRPRQQKESNVKKNLEKETRLEAKPRQQNESAIKKIVRHGKEALQNDSAESQEEEDSHMRKQSHKKDTRHEVRREKKSRGDEQSYSEESQDDDDDYRKERSSKKPRQQKESGIKKAVRRGKEALQNDSAESQDEDEGHIKKESHKKNTRHGKESYQKQVRHKKHDEGESYDEELHIEKESGHGNKSHFEKEVHLKKETRSEKKPGQQKESGIKQAVRRGKEALHDDDSQEESHSEEEHLQKESHRGNKSYHEKEIHLEKESRSDKKPRQQKESGVKKAVRRGKEALRDDDSQDEQETHAKKESRKNDSRHEARRSKKTYEDEQSYSEEESQEDDYRLDKGLPPKNTSRSAKPRQQKESGIKKAVRRTKEAFQNNSEDDTASQNDDGDQSVSEESLEDYGEYRLDKELPPKKTSRSTKPRQQKESGIKKAVRRGKEALQNDSTESQDEEESHVKKQYRKKNGKDTFEKEVHYKKYNDGKSRDREFHLEKETRNGKLVHYKKESRVENKDPHKKEYRREKKVYRDEESQTEESQDDDDDYRQERSSKRHQQKESGIKKAVRRTKEAFQNNSEDDTASQDDDGDQSVSEESLEDYGEYRLDKELPPKKTSRSTKPRQQKESGIKKAVRRTKEAFQNDSEDDSASDDDYRLDKELPPKKTNRSTKPRQQKESGIKKAVRRTKEASQNDSASESDYESLDYRRKSDSYLNHHDDHYRLEKELPARKEPKESGIKKVVRRSKEALGMEDNSDEENVPTKITNAFRRLSLTKNRKSTGGLDERLEKANLSPYGFRQVYHRYTPVETDHVILYSGPSTLQANSKGTLSGQDVIRSTVLDRPGQYNSAALDRPGQYSSAALDRPGQYNSAALDRPGQYNSAVLNRPVETHLMGTSAYDRPIQKSSAFKHLPEDSLINRWEQEEQESPSRTQYLSGQMELGKASVQKMVGKITNSDSMKEKGEKAEIAGKEKVESYKTNKELESFYQY